MINFKDEKATHYEFEMIRPGEEAQAFRKEMQIIFVLRGTGWLHMEDGESSYVVKEEDLFVINSFQIYSLILEEQGLAISLLMDPTFLAIASPDTQNPYFQCKSFLYQEEQQRFQLLRQDYARAFRAWYKKESDRSVHLRSKMIIILDDLVQYFMQKNGEERSESGRERLRSAVDYINKNYNNNITLIELSKQTFLSTSYLSRSFQKYMGISFVGYLTQVRLLHVAAFLRGEKTITEIAYETGFSSSSALIDSFKQYYGITPGQYRKEMLAKRKTSPEHHLKTEEGLSTEFISLMKYAGVESETQEKEQKDDNNDNQVEEIIVNAMKAERSLLHKWKTVINVGYAKDILNSDLQSQIRILQQNIGFKYLRCKGILDDDMMLYTKDMYGKASYNFVYIDQVIEFILSVGAKPMLEFSHMPLAIAKNRNQIFRRPVYISVPEKSEQWIELVQEVMDHLTERFGIEQMKTWWFSPWLSVDIGQFGFFAPTEYMEVYESSYKIIKNTCPEFKICGAGNSIEDLERLKWFLDICKQKECLPDILSLKSFAAIHPEEEENGLKLEISDEAFMVAVSGDEDYLRHKIKKLKNFLEGERLILPIILDEWSNNIWQRDLCNDTCYKSAYLFKNILENCDSMEGMAYYNLCDQLDEIAPAEEKFHGGFGLFTKDGIKKSAFWAMELLGNMGEKLIAKGEGYFISASGNEIQIYLYNYCHYDTLYRYRNTTNLSKKERYKVFNEKSAQSYHIQLEGIKEGNYQIKKYSISPKGGSVYDTWIEIGAPEKMSRTEEDLMAASSYPKYYTQRLEVVDSISIKTCLQPHEVQLFMISKRAGSW